MVWSSHSNGMVADIEVWHTFWNQKTATIVESFKKHRFLPPRRLHSQSHGSVHLANALQLDHVTGRLGGIQNYPDSDVLRSIVLKIVRFCHFESLTKQLHQLSLRISPGKCSSQKPQSRSKIRAWLFLLLRGRSGHLCLRTFYMNFKCLFLLFFQASCRHSRCLFKQVGSNHARKAK